MDIYPSFVSDDKGFQKKYEKIFITFRYEEPEIKELLSMFNITDTISSVHFNGELNVPLMGYILKCMIITVKNECKNDSIKSMAKVISSFNRSEITKALQFLYPKTKKYSLTFLVSSAATYQPPKLTQKELLDKIVNVPKGYVYSLDLMIYVKINIHKKYSSSIPVVSNNKVFFEYVHVLLFGCESDKFIEWTLDRSKYLDIDTGKTISNNKVNSYMNIDKKCHIVSSTSDIYVYSSKILNTYMSEVEEIVLDKLHKSPGVKKCQDDEDKKGKRKSRKTIPKAIKNQLWRKYFGDKMKGECYCCKSEIDALENWQAGHIQAASLGGSDKIDNLRPLCSTCNQSMSNMNMDDYIKRYH